MQCQFLGQGGCGEGCTQGLPGVPGMAVAKGGSGDTGKPGVTPLDSCDMVRPWGTGRNIFEHPSMILPSQNHTTLLWWMQNGSLLFCIVCMAWLEELSLWPDVIAVMLDSFLLFFFVFQCLEKLQATQPVVSSHQWRFPVSPYANYTYTLPSVSVCVSVGLWDLHRKSWSAWNAWISRTARGIGMYVEEKTKFANFEPVVQPFLSYCNCRVPPGREAMLEYQEISWVFTGILLKTFLKMDSVFTFVFMLFSFLKEQAGIF